MKEKLRLTLAIIFTVIAGVGLIGTVGFTVCILVKVTWAMFIQLAMIVIFGTVFVAGTILAIIFWVLYKKNRGKNEHKIN